MTDRKFHRRRLAVKLAVGVVALAGPLTARAQKVHRLGLMLPRAGPGGHMVHFYRALQERGYEEGRNLVIERRQAQGRDDEYAALAAELVRLPVDVLVAAGPSATRAARAATTTIPIVMGSQDAVEQGLIASLARPGGNITGWTLLAVESAEKQLSLLKEALPRLARVALVANPRVPGHRSVVERVSGGARKMGMHFLSVEVASPEALEPAFATMAKERIEGFFATPDPIVMDRVAGELTALAARAKLPGIYQWRTYVQAGGLMSYGPSLADLVASWATFVDKILKGAKPADLPVETPRKFELILNAKAAAALGFNLPAALMLAADDVIR